MYTFPLSLTHIQRSGITPIIMAVSTQWHTFPQRFDWIAEHGFAMAYTPNAEQLQLTGSHIRPYLDQNIPIRHHGFFPGYELGDASYEKAEAALTLHKHAVDTIVGLGEQVMTIHIGLVPTIKLNPQYTEKNLCRLVQYAAEKGVTIALENLRRGPTSNPDYVVDLAAVSGSCITLDVGHAVSCDMVRTGMISVPDIISLFSPALEEVHFYEYETDTHYAPEDMSVLAPIVDKLLDTRCRWWTIELIEYNDILSTWQLVQDHIVHNRTVLAAA